LRVFECKAKKLSSIHSEEAVMWIVHVQVIGVVLALFLSMISQPPPAREDRDGMLRAFRKTNLRRIV
jgi:hypothetical protein